MRPRLFCKLGLAFSVFQFAIFLTCAQPFVAVPFPTSGDYRGGHLWVDLDNDNDLDLVLTSDGGGTLNPQLRVYRNDGGGAFSLRSTTLPQVVGSRMIAGDYNRDGRMDFLLNGYGLGFSANWICRNDGNWQFTVLTNVLAGEGTWGDFDGDGDLDLAQAVDISIAPPLLRQQAGIFSPLPLNPPRAFSGAETWLDFDRDGDLDLATGAFTGIAVERNEGFDAFQAQSLTLPGSASASFGVAWADFDGDGDLDAAVNNQGGFSRLYRNDGSSFVELTFGIVPANTYSSTWADSDNDGDLDLLAASNSDGIPATTGVDLLRNDGSSLFTALGLHLPAGFNGSVSWVDFDRDGDLDFFMQGGCSGAIGCQPAQLFRNDVTRTNSRPIAPAGLTAGQLADGRTQLTWLPGADLETTNANLLTYELRLGTNSGGYNVSAPPADAVSGVRRVCRPGAIRTNLWQLHGLPTGTYYWSVQTVDSGYAGSPWASQGSFVITNTPPVFGPLADRQSFPGVQVVLTFTVSDGQSAPEQIEVNVTCTNSTVLPPAGIQLLGTSAQRTLALTPAAAGETWVRVTATDPQASFTAREFRLTVPQFAEFELGFETGTYVLGASVVDADDDGDLDVFLNGGLVRGGVNQSQMLGRNPGNGNFAWEPWIGTNDPLALEEWANSSHRWQDWDRDGRLDLVVAASGKLTIFRNLGSGFAALPQVTRAGGFGAVAWQDFNHDGLLDGLHAVAQSEILRQEGSGHFLALPQPKWQSSFFDHWIDFDSDGFTDLLTDTAFYRQAANAFILTTNTLQTYFNPGVADLDADGDVDVVGAEGATIVLSLNSGGTFSRKPAGGDASGNPLVSADFNNDGFNDLVYPYAQFNGSLAHQHLNDGTANFPLTNSIFSSAVTGSLLFGDFDNDGDLDLLSTGGSLRWIRNLLGGTNAPPSPPVLDAAAPLSNDTVLLRWHPATDDHTPTAALTYEVQLQSTGSPDYVITSVSHPATGFRRLMQPGSVGARTNFLVRDLPPGQYTWRVQAMDSSLTGSAWSTAGSFTVAKPVLSGLHDIYSPGGVASRPLPFTVTSANYPATALTVTVVAEDNLLVPSGGIQLSGSGTNRTLVINPALTNGVAFIQITATDPAGFSDIQTFRINIEAFSPEQITTPFTGSWAYNAISAWADFDSDGDLDLATYGSDAGRRVSTLLFRNPGTGVLAAETNVTYDLGWDTMLAGDFDHDNVPDLFFAGGINPRVVRVATGRPDFAMEPVEVGLTASWGSRSTPASCWLDTDNDGPADAVFFLQNASGAEQTLSFALTPGTGFSRNPRVLLNYRPASWVWTDVDRDGDADLLTTFRDALGFRHVYLHANSQTGLLAQVEIATANTTGHLSANDYDGDGWPDLLLLASVPRLFRNQQNSTFAEVANALPQGGWSTATWGDLDNDGRQDVVLTAGGSTVAFRNLGGGQFAEMPAPLPAVSGAGVALADADGDGDLDFLLDDREHYNAAQYFCRNQAVVSNTPPMPPAGLWVERQPAGLMLHWNAASDLQTPTTALTYNVRLGTSPGGSEVLSALAATITGQRKAVGPGNASSLQLPLNFLPRGPLYWSVQSIDGAYAGSAFVSEQVYQTNPPSLSTIPDLTLPPNLSSGPFPLDVADAQTPRELLQWNVISDNEALLPASNVVISIVSTGALLHFTPARHQSGTAQLVLTVTDQQGEWSGLRFTVTVPEEFTLTQTNFPQLVRGSAAWGDYDQDGDVDLLTAGFTGLPFVAGSGRTDLWRNEGGLLNPIPVLNFADGGAGDVSFVDADSDGDLDLSVCGGNNFTLLFWQTSPGVFSAAPGNWFAGANRAAMAWGDRDGDGDPELVISGNIANQMIASSRTWLYQNQKPSGFTSSTLLTTGLRDGSAEWIDVDNDGDNDLFLTGSTTFNPSGSQTLLYLNNNGVLTSTATGLPGVTDSAHVFADFDNDGDPDLVLCGLNFGMALYLNNGLGQFTAVQTNLPAYAFGNLAAADFDNDGDPDLLISGVGPQDSRTELWHNESGQLFPTGNQFNGKAGRGLAWGDFDTDGDLDLAIVGSPDDGYSPPRIPYFTGVFRNDLNLSPPTLPAPQQLAAVVNGANVALAWSMPGGTPSGLSYNVRVGTSPFAGNVMSAPAEALMGQLLRPARGNAGWSRSWQLRNLPNGLYYWSVQAVGPTFQRAPFAAVTSFSIPPSPASPPHITGFTVATDGTIQLTAAGQANRYVFLEISDDLESWSFSATLQFNGSGQLIWNGGVTSSRQFFRLRQP